jgi:DNA invertase Pin-like site-specific DNA recombinase
LHRLGRETRLILNAVADLEKLGVRVRSMTEEFDTVAGTIRVAEAGAWLGG